MTSKLFKASIALIVVGAVLLVTLQVLYAPTIQAFQNDLQSYIENLPNNTHTPPLIQEYGLDSSTMLLIVILGNAASIILFIGAAFLVITLIAHFVKRRQGSEVTKPVETP